MNPKAIAAPGATLLAPDDHTLIMIDFQPQMSLAAASIDGICLRNNVALVANAAKAFAVSAIVTTMAAQSFGGPVLNELRTALPRHRVIDRTDMNCWQDAGVIAEINRLDKRRIVVCGLWTSVCVAWSVLSALDQDFVAYVITDACGDISKGSPRPRH
jgi:nicotinamidase-related amidase